MIQKTYHVSTCLLGIMLPQKNKQNPRTPNFEPPAHGL